MSDAILDLIDSLYDEHIKDFPNTDRESFTAGAEATINYLIKTNKL